MLYQHSRHSDRVLLIDNTVANMYVAACMYCSSIRFTYSIFCDSIRSYSMAFISLDVLYYRYYSRFISAIAPMTRRISSHLHGYHIPGGG
jgi:hypothetical protein